MKEISLETFFELTTNPSQGEFGDKDHMAESSNAECRICNWKIQKCYWLDHFHKELREHLHFHELAEKFGLDN